MPQIAARATERFVQGESSVDIATRHCEVASATREDRVDADGELRWLADAARSAGYNLARLAENLGFSLKQLRWYFNVRRWGNPKHVLDRIRAIQAAGAVINGCSAKQVAFDFGYSDTAHFNRALKRHLEVTPSRLIACRSRHVLPQPFCKRGTFIQLILVEARDVSPQRRGAPHPCTQ